MQQWARFVWSDSGLWPGPINFNDHRLYSHSLHIEFRNNEIYRTPLNKLRDFIENHGDVQVDCNSKSHKEVMDLLMLGCNRVSIDIFTKNNEIELCHAVSEQLILAITLPSNLSLTYLTDTLFPRLNEVKDLGPSSVLIISKRKGDLAFVIDKIPKDLRNYFSWLLAPEEGDTVPISNNQNILGWILDGERRIGV